MKQYPVNCAALPNMTSCVQTDLLVDQVTDTPGHVYPCRSAVGIVGDNCGARSPPWTIVRILSNACSHVHLCVNVYCERLGGAETFLSICAPATQILTPPHHTIANSEVRLFNPISAF